MSVEYNGKVYKIKKKDERRRTELAEIKKKSRKSENTGQTLGKESFMLSMLSFLFFSQLAAILPLLNSLFAFSAVQYAFIYHIGWLLPAIAVILGILSIVKEKTRERLLLV
jgi:hypothetical protein